jgi:hypothetical protein
MKYNLYAKYTLAGSLAIGDVIQALRAKILTPCFCPKFFGSFFFCWPRPFFYFPYWWFRTKYSVAPFIFYFRLSFDPFVLVSFFLFLRIFQWLSRQRTSLPLHFHKIVLVLCLSSSTFDICVWLQFLPSTLNETRVEQRTHVCAWYKVVPDSVM